MRYIAIGSRRKGKTEKQGKLEEKQEAVPGYNQRVIDHPMQRIIGGAGIAKDWEDK